MIDVDLIYKNVFESSIGLLIYFYWLDHFLLDSKVKREMQFHNITKHQINLYNMNVGYTLL